MRKLPVTAVLLLATASTLSAQPSPPPDPNKIQVLILTGQHVHPWKETTPVLKQILEDTKKFEVRINEELRGMGPETLANYDLVVINYYNRGAKERWGERAEGALQSFVASGKGLVIYHLALGAFDGWAEFEKMSGGNWRPNNGHHSARHDFTVFNTALGHDGENVKQVPFAVTFARGAEWAAKGVLTVPIPPELAR
jgi:type 1 glutamine amidotransferase